MKRVVVIGAGQIGSRHLQALKKCPTPLSIDVVEPNEMAQRTARERWSEIELSAAHRTAFYRTMPEMPESQKRYDLAIVATNSGDRLRAVEDLLGHFPVTYLVLEKILITKSEDGSAISRLVRKTGARAWVNCCMRQMPVYREIRRDICGQRFDLHVSGSLFGLMTNAIHYADFFAWLSGGAKFMVNASGLDANPVASKRAGYSEMTGTLRFSTDDGSTGSVTCFGTGTLPVSLAVQSGAARFRVSRGKLWSARAAEDWREREEVALIPLQSDLTTEMAAGLLERGVCELTELGESLEIHRALFDSVLGRVGPEFSFT